MGSLPPGKWPIYVVTYYTNPPISRPIGVEGGILAVLPEGSNPPLVRITSFRTIENN